MNAITIAIMWMLYPALLLDVIVRNRFVKPKVGLHIADVYEWVVNG